MGKINYFGKINSKLIRKRKFLINLMLLIVIITVSGCTGYKKYYNYYSGENQKIFYPKKVSVEYIHNLSSLINKEVSLFYGYFFPGVNVRGINTVILIDENFNHINSKLLESVNKKTHIMNFDRLLLGNFEYPHGADEDIIGLNLEGTNLIFLKKSRYDSLESLTTVYLAELSHILLYRNSVKNSIKLDNKYDYLSEFFTDIISQIHITGKKEYTFEEVRTKLDDILKNVYEYGYPDTLKDPNNFRIEKLYDYLDDFKGLFHIMIENETAYEKFRKTMVELFTKQYYTVDNNTIDRPFIDNYGETLDKLIASWSPKRM